jgi:hypothetical protein
MLKKLMMVVLALIVVLAVVAGLLLWRIDDIAKAGIQAGGEYALGVPTTVETVDLGLFGGTFDMAGLQIANPAGFDQAPYLMRNGAFALEVTNSSFWSDTIEVPLIELDGLDVYIVKTGDGNNISPVLDHLKKFEGGEKAEEQTGSGKKFIIRKLVIRNVTAHLDVPVLGHKQVALGKPIVLEELTGDNAQGLMMSEIMARLFPMITSVALQTLGDLVPTDLAGVLEGDLAGVADHLGGNVKQLIEEPSKMIGDLKEQAEKQIGRIKDDMGEKIKQGLGDDVDEKVKQGADKVRDLFD